MCCVHFRSLFEIYPCIRAIGGTEIPFDPVFHMLIGGICKTARFSTFSTYFLKFFGELETVKPTNKSRRLEDAFRARAPEANHTGPKNRIRYTARVFRKITFPSP